MIKFFKKLVSKIVINAVIENYWSDGKIRQIIRSERPNERKIENESK